MMPFHKAHQNFICQQRTRTNIKNHIENWVGLVEGDENEDKENLLSWES